MKLEQVLARWARNTTMATAGRRPPDLEVAGRWTNAYGSVADLHVHGDRISGTYTSTVGSKRQEIAGPVTGFVSGDVVAFSVLWPAHMRSITSWVGQVVDVDGTPVLKTLWQLVVDIPDEEEPSGLWTTVHTGADEFR